MKLPKILLIYAGGTIGMKQDLKTGALRPALNSMEILENAPEIQKYVSLDFKMLINIDSSNMIPKHWTKIAEEIHDNYDKYDGFVVIQGTDTMSYSASALSFALQNLGKPIVFTGSLIPINEIGSDARNNLVYACLTATIDIAEVCLVFGNRIIRGNRSKKYYESLRAGFHSPNYPYLGEMGRPIQLNEWRKKRHNRVVTFSPNFDSNISLLKLFPGFDPIVLEKVIDSSVKGIVIEGFGPGNIPSLENSILDHIKKAVQRKIPVVIANQMEKGVSNLNSYEVGYMAQKIGAISSKDMTTEATVTKLMWVLKQKKNISEINKIMGENLAGELKV